MKLNKLLTKQAEKFKTLNCYGGVALFAFVCKSAVIYRVVESERSSGNTLIFKFDFNPRYQCHLVLCVLIDLDLNFFVG